MVATKAPTDFFKTKKLDSYKAFAGVAQPGQRREFLCSSRRKAKLRFLILNGKPRPLGVRGFKSHPPHSFLLVKNRADRWFVSYANSCSRPISWVILVRLEQSNSITDHSWSCLSVWIAERTRRRTTMARQLSPQ